MNDFNQLEWLKYAVTHIFEGFEDMRWKKSGSMKIAVIIIFLLFFSRIAEERLYGFQFRESYDKTFSIIPYIVSSFVVFGAWVIGSNAVSTFLDGEGSLRNIFIYSAYSLVPYIAQSFINTVLSHFLVKDEYVFMQAIEITGILWTAILLFSAIKAVHQYSFVRTAVSVVLTITAMFIMLFLLILFMSLVQQMYLFISTLYTEISYRIRV
ncbi:MAG: YIP1 family protein [Ruminococcus flavefaciens]|nr:YIP1 family protein [Ruminococcus flavefaciens]MCM1228565.1 YIP1 family protein [Ruminococcus flavefaciens]